MRRAQKKRRSADHVLGKCLVASLLGMAVYVTGNLEGQASVKYPEPLPVVLKIPAKAQSAKKPQAAKLTKSEYQIALTGCGDDWVCMGYLDYQRKQGRVK